MTKFDDFVFDEVEFDEIEFTLVDLSEYVQKRKYK